MHSSDTEEIPGVNNLRTQEAIRLHSWPQSGSYPRVAVCTSGAVRREKLEGEVGRLKPG